MNSTDFKMASWISLSGKTLQKLNHKPVFQNRKDFNLLDLKKTEWSNKFENLMRNRLITGAFRYGPLHMSGKPKYDRIESILKRAQKYKETGNKEFLVDMANLCLLEFEECNNPLEHFSSIDDGEHVKSI